MPVRRVLAHDGVEEDRGKAAIQRGPVVYCREALDNVAVDNVAADHTAADHKSGVMKVLPLDAELRHRFDRGLLGGVEVITGKDLVAVPYFAWNHRGKGERSEERRVGIAGVMDVALWK